MRPLLLLGVSFVALIGGAWLIGLWMVGVAIMVEAVTVATFAVLWDDDKTGTTGTGDAHADVLERWRRTP